MSHDTLEQAVLSGALFRDPSAVMSEFREEDRSTPSPEPNTDDELGSDYSPPSSPRPSPGTGVENSRSTGVKGVIKDSKQAALRARETQLARRLLANQALEERALLAPTWDEDEELRAGEDGDVAEVARRWAKQPSSAGPGGDQRERARGGEGAGAGGPRKGYLREVSMQGYLNAVDHAEGWVVILVFEPVRPSYAAVPSARSLASSAALTLPHAPPLPHRPNPAPRRTSKISRPRRCSPSRRLPRRTRRRRTRSCSHGARPCRSSCGPTASPTTTSCRRCSSTPPAESSAKRLSVSTSSSRSARAASRACYGGASALPREHPLTPSLLGLRGLTALARAPWTATDTRSFPAGAPTTTPTSRPATLMTASTTRRASANPPPIRPAFTPLAPLGRPTRPSLPRLQFADEQVCPHSPLSGPRLAHPMFPQLVPRPPPAFPCRVCTPAHATTHAHDPLPLLATTSSPTSKPPFRQSAVLLATAKTGRDCRRQAQAQRGSRRAGKDRKDGIGWTLP